MLGLLEPEKGAALDNGRRLQGRNVWKFQQQQGQYVGAVQATRRHPMMWRSVQLTHSALLARMLRRNPTSRRAS